MDTLVHFDHFGLAALEKTKIDSSSPEN